MWRWRVLNPLEETEKWTGREQRKRERERERGKEEIVEKMRKENN